MSTASKFKTKRFLSLGAAALVALSLSACVHQGGDKLGEGIGFREARFAEISAMREWRKCRDEGIELDRQAKASQSVQRYLASAKLLEKCESSVGPDASGVDGEARMRAYALTVQNYLKGGDIAKARENLDRFHQSFPNADLYYSDGSSFSETMEILLGTSKENGSTQFSLANVNSGLKAELRRVRHWANN